MARTVGSDAEDTRRRILGETTALFIERGYASTSIRDISERLGMTKGALYYHFTSKEELLHAIVAPLLSGLRAFVGDVRDAGTVRPELVRELVDLLDANAPLVRSLSSDPAVSRSKLEGRGAGAPFAELAQLLSGTDDGDALRGRCAVGLIFASVIGPPPHKGLDDSPAGRRLTEPEKRFVTAAAMAVLAMPAP
ncbi:TetR family transcriptional regulator [Actinoplanes lobatus]|uniref:AcrR family transcriptional regulator n=1 Tax=Actinoplanes lobatus TaxID=113568 RepID=A0A7W7HJG6_9ACTN|nr:TetR/AcrR family transcriptional regulator [Actinoplanes lobatus]MBB4751688.1 AcrR family transcriptional regulator [Actinoplanes lobatus]GGN65286.1 TetR family transcriptional regulator [Actinoplanes lobatus]GIE43271.1 TetR family transcriptional regulator [Actinoplanes lobatus]